MRAFKKVIVIGLDGLEPKIVSRLLATGELPNLARLRDMGGYSRVATTYPAQTPVAWSTFATGTNPGGHGIFDFIRRDPQTYLPDLSLNRYEQKNKFVPPKAVNLRGGKPVWECLSDAGIPAAIIRCPCTYPPDKVHGRMLAGMGVPDLRGGLGTSSFYTSDDKAQARESENIIHLQPARNETITTHLTGPRIHLPITIHLEPQAGKITIKPEGQPNALEVREGRWSDWLKLKFKMGMLQSVRGMVRFYLVRQAPIFELYASPINFDPELPLFPICSPFDYAAELEESLGPFYTTGMAEDHTGLNNGRFEEEAFLSQCNDVVRERERMMLYELERLKEGLFFCLFDTPDRVQHMFWRFQEQEPLTRRGNVTKDFSKVIDDYYRKCDQIVGKALHFADDQTLFFALSDHGFNSFQRGMHLNTWLYDNGFLALRNGAKPGEECGEMLKQVDWDRTKAYALGLGSIYLNLKDREANGCVDPAEAGEVKRAIAQGLTGLIDPQLGKEAIRSAISREQIYSGTHAVEAPDLIVNFSEGYRASWSTGLGGVPEGHFEDNVKRWSGDHIIDPQLVPGVLFMNHRFNGEGARLVDLAPTILSALKTPKGEKMEGESLLV
jgi:predicted AlkP superfamily phosphohydrolase/phosphomutase